MASEKSQQKTDQSQKNLSKNYFPSEKKFGRRKNGEMKYAEKMHSYEKRYEIPSELTKSSTIERETTKSFQPRAATTEYHFD